jgi:hypothetical protein
MDFVGLPLLILASVAIVYVLVQGRDIIQPLFFAVFFNYLIRPLMDCLTTPFDQCIRFAWSDPNPLASCRTFTQIMSHPHELYQPYPMSIQASSFSLQPHQLPEAVSALCEVLCVQLHR